MLTYERETTVYVLSEQSQWLEKNKAVREGVRIQSSQSTRVIISTDHLLSYVINYSKIPQSSLTGCFKRQLVRFSSTVAYCLPSSSTIATRNLQDRDQKSMWIYMDIHFQHMGSVGSCPVQFDVPVEEQLRKGLVDIQETFPVGIYIYLYIVDCFLP